MSSVRAGSEPPAKTRISGERVRALLPEVWALVRPRRRLFLLGLVLIGIHRAAGLALPLSTKVVLDDIIGKKHGYLLAPLVLGVLAAFTIQGTVSFALAHVLTMSAQRLISEMRRKVHAHISLLPLAYYDRNSVGGLVSRIMSDVEGLRNLVGSGLVEFLGGLISAAFAFVGMMRISPMLTLVALVSITTFGLFVRGVFKSVRPIFRERGRLNAEVSGRLTESLGGVRVVKGYHAELREQGVFAAGVERLLDNSIRTIHITARSGFMSSLLLGVMCAATTYLGGRQILAGQIRIGDFVMFMVLLAYLTVPVLQTVSVGTQLTDAFAGLDRTMEVLSERLESDDPRRAVELSVVQGSVRFANVDFAYKAGETVLHGISFDASPGAVTALVGPSGSGKSTIIGLVAGFYNPEAGVVTVDGVDLTTVKLSSYRTQLGVVLQDTFLFDGTIRDNVAFGHPDAGEAEILEACRTACVSEFAERFEQKYDTLVGERGVKLSGGQRQRVAVARAILADPRILILDEATSSLDSESEALIQQGLSHLMRGRTTFVIAHRLSTTRRADQILFIEGGRVVERGTHASLLAAGGRYYDLYTRQHGVETDLFLAPGEGDTETERDAPAPRRALESGPSLKEAIPLLGAVGKGLGLG